jgi:hypothetical protein
MKKMMIVSVCLLGSAFCSGQSQDIQQLVMDIEKLAQMKSMLSSMYNGYNILSQGYNQVSSVTKGNFDLHKSYLDGLLKVSSRVRKYEKIAGVVSSQLWIVNECKTSYKNFSTVFNARELLEISLRYAEMMEQTGRNVDQLMLVISPGQLRMSDAERITAIDTIDKDVAGTAAELTAYNERNSCEMKRRLQMKNNIEASRQLFGVK